MPFGLSESIGRAETLRFSSERGGLERWVQLAPTCLALGVVRALSLPYCLPVHTRPRGRMSPIRPRQGQLRRATRSSAPMFPRTRGPTLLCDL